MFLDSGDAKYMDIAEISLFNNALAGISLSGDSFFYVNPLEADGDFKFNHGVGERAPWYGCSCCPPNISRLILQVPGYMYAYTKNRIYFTLYGTSTTTVPIKGQNIHITQESGYPFDGRVRIVMTHEHSTSFSVYMRVPTWCISDEFCPGGLYPYSENLSLSDISAVNVLVNGSPVSYTLDKGFAVIERKWTEGDVIELDLAMPVRRVQCNPEVKDNIGLSAFVRGPLVYCAEEIDNGPAEFLECCHDIGNPEVDTIRSGQLSGINSFSVPGVRKDGSGKTEYTGITMVPYYAWCNRGGSKSMKVWLPDNDNI